MSYTFTKPEAELPEAVVTPKDEPGTATVDGTEYALEAEYVFTFKEGEPTAAQLAAYGDWNCDYIVSFDKDVAAGTVGLYGVYGEYEPVAFLNPEALSANVEVALVKEVLQLDDNLTLKDLAENVKEFDCGVFNIDPANVGTTINVELRIWKGEETHKAAEVSYTFTKPETYTVTVSSQDTNGNIGIATVSGGGEYVAGEEVTVTAPVTQGYSFIGWYADSYTGDPVSVERTYVFTASEGVDLIAVYKATGSGLLTVIGNKYNVDGQSYTSTNNFDYPAGQSVTLEYTGENFEYWVNASHNIVSTSPTYTFTFVGTKTTIEAYSSSSPEDGEETANLYFLNAYKQVLSKGVVDDDEDTIMELFPKTNPTKMGETFERWVIDETGEEATVEAIRKLLSSGPGATVIHIKPEYSSKNETYTVTIIVNGETVQTLTAKTGEPIVVTKSKVVEWSDAVTSVDEIGYWSLDGGNTAVSYADQYTVVSAVDGTEINLTAVLGAMAPEPVITITQMFATVNGEKYKISTTLKYSAPEGYTVLESGFVYGTDNSLADPDNLVIDGANVRKHISGYTDSNVTYTMNINTSDASRVAYVRAFLTYIDSENTITTIYSNVVSGSYSSLNG